MENIEKNLKNNKLISILVVVLIVLFFVKIITEVKIAKNLNSGIAPTSTISFEGKGEVFAVPDIATISFFIEDEAKTLKEAQDKINPKVKKIIELLKENKIAEKDIKNTNYNSYPKYENVFEKTMTNCLAIGCPQPQKQKIYAYGVSQGITVKVRNIDDTSKIIDLIGEQGVTSLNGPVFEIDNEDKLKEQARDMAIKEAKEKADKLSSSLGVKLVRIVSFSENSNGYPMMYSKTNMARELSDSSSGAEIPKGENVISSQITITYEIR